MPNIGFTILDMADFVIANRKNKSFESWSRESICASLYRAYQENTLHITQVDGQITGLIHWIEIPDQKKIFVVNILTNGSKGIISAFMKIFYDRYSDYSLAGYRYGKEVIYKNTNRLVKL